MKNRQIKKEIRRNYERSGFTLVEILIAVSILSLILGFVGAFQADVFSLNRFIQTGLQSQSDAKKIIRPFANEVRSAAPSNLGAYHLAETATSSFAFYSDIDNDGLREKVRYYLDGSDFKKSVIKPAGQPLVYNQANEKIIRVVENVVDDNIFEYFDSNYDGTASSTALVQPVNISEVRLIKIRLSIDKDLGAPPGPIEVMTQVSIRNLKDNF